MIMLSLSVFVIVSHCLSILFEALYKIYRSFDYCNSLLKCTAVWVRGDRGICCTWTSCTKLNSTYSVFVVHVFGHGLQGSIARETVAWPLPHCCQQLPVHLRGGREGREWREGVGGRGGSGREGREGGGGRLMLSVHSIVNLARAGARLQYS